MIIATNKNKEKNNRTEFHQVTGSAYEVKRYRAGYNDGTWELSGAWYFDSYSKAEAFFNNLK